MKNLLFVIFMAFSIICQAQTSQFEKPRYLKYAIFVCPIDMTKSYSKKGIIYGNKASIDTISKIVYETMTDANGKLVPSKKALIDTILTKTILMERGLAFEVVQQIGSFSIIKFWNLYRPKADDLIKSSLEKTKEGIKTTEASLGKTRNSLKETKESLKNINGSLKNKKDSLETTEASLEKTMGSLENTKNRLEKTNKILQEPLPNDTFHITERKGLIAVVDGVGYDLASSFYIVPTKTIQNNSTEFESKRRSWNVGFLVLPIKLQLFATESGHFEFSNSFSLGTAFYWTALHNWKTNYTSNLLLYAGVTSYKADFSKIKEPREDYNILAFSPAIGWMWEKNNIQLSLLAGIDFPAGNLQKKWVYRNQPWLGIGVGIGIFKINSDTKTASGSN